MLIASSRRGPAVPDQRAWVFSYDVACPKRARRVRQTLAAWQTAAQYSVFEAWLTASQRNDVLAELVSLCDPDEDRLATWSPRRGQCVELAAAGLLVRGVGGATAGSQVLADVLCSGNLMVCYDIRDEDRLRRISATVGRRTVAVQRSVYWLRGGLPVARGLLESLLSLRGEGDSIRAYPLAHAGDLWRVQTQASSLLPMMTGEARVRSAS